MYTVFRGVNKRKQRMHICSPANHSEGHQNIFLILFPLPIAFWQTEGHETFSCPGAGNLSNTSVVIRNISHASIEVSENNMKTAWKYVLSPCVNDFCGRDPQKDTLSADGVKLWHAVGVMECIQNVVSAFSWRISHQHKSRKEESEIEKIVQT